MSGPTGMMAGVITVGSGATGPTTAGDGTYTISPAAGPFGVPATSTSMAQSIFEQWYPTLLSASPQGPFPPATQATVINTTTTPPTTNKGAALYTLAQQCNAIAAGIVGYMDANALINVTVTVPATGIDDSGGHACTGSASGTGTGTIT